jgi:hypothetical protein
LVEPMTVHIAEAAERRESVACRHCPAKAELIVSMISPKDGRTLRVFRCRCGKLTSTDDRPVNKAGDVAQRGQSVHAAFLFAREI